MASSRAGLRFLSQSVLTRPAFTTFRSPVTRQAITRRTQSTVAGVPTSVAGNAPPKSGFSSFWNSNVGPKTVHFWAPVMKWCLVLAGIADFARPAESLSLTQNLALVGTGAIWTRWCFVIKPRNLFLAAVNFFLFCVGTTQVTRIMLHNQSLKNTSVGDEIKDQAKKQESALEGVVQDAKNAVKQAVK